MKAHLINTWERWYDLNPYTLPHLKRKTPKAQSNGSQKRYDPKPDPSGTRVYDETDYPRFAMIPRSMILVPS